MFSGLEKFFGTTVAVGHCKMGVGHSAIVTVVAAASNQKWVEETSV